MQPILETDRKVTTTRAKPALWRKKPIKDRDSPQEACTSNNCITWWFTSGSRRVITPTIYIILLDHLPLKIPGRTVFSHLDPNRRFGFLALKLFLSLLERWAGNMFQLLGISTSPVDGWACISLVAGGARVNKTRSHWLRPHRRSYAELFHASLSFKPKRLHHRKKWWKKNDPFWIPNHYTYESWSGIVMHHWFWSVPNVSFEALNLILPSVNIVEGRWAMRLLEIILIIFGVPLGNLT